ncbi:type II toxin-antitoxin system VapC family toxin [Rhizobium mesoamericanum]|uniref:Ribonuclease VapC n=1 Tax=Rhizobium mesoamericanum STM3625 TaxID=1211777 RepID=K0PVF9_9HYPH|nr:type II toxin-antitoxin system VapC family toxin [Rhizobium mesoamericanum]CCM75505.1 PilT protein domain protein [Rhizobium mesoamericanum STM3625]
MIAVDTSAIMAIVFDEPQSEACMMAIEEADGLLISAATVAEAMIVASRRNVGEEVSALISGLGFEIVSVTAASARRVADAYSRWGKGVHPAALNYGDCFSYEVAKEHDCPLLYVGEDFVQTDVRPAL